MLCKKFVELGFYNTFGYKQQDLVTQSEGSGTKETNHNFYYLPPKVMILQKALVSGKTSMHGEWRRQTLV